MTKASLRREAEFRRVPLKLSVERNEEASLSIECWAWWGWRELAHLVGHYARSLGARQDNVTSERLRCNRRACPLDRLTTELLSGQKATPHVERELKDFGLLESLGAVAVAFAFGFLLVLFGLWMKAESSGWDFAAATFGGALFAVLMAGLVLFEKVKG